MPEQKSRAGQGRRVRETQKQRRERQEAEARDKIRRQVEDGTLVIRQMTAEERLKYPPRQTARSQKQKKLTFDA
jgi:hypothetical protein